MKIAWKLALIIVFMAIPIVVTLGFFVANSQKDLFKVESEIGALEYVTALRGLLESVPQHRGTAQGVIAGDSGQQSVLRRLSADVDQGLVRLDERDQELGQALQTSERSARIRRSWRALKTKATQLTSQDSFTRHTQLVADVTDLVRHVAGTGQLVGDPEVESSFLVEVVIEQIPDTLENLGVLRGLGNGILARGEVTPNDQARLSELVSRIRLGVDDVDAGLRASFRTRADLEEALLSDLISAAADIQSFVSIANSRLIRAREIDLDAVEFFAGGTRSISALLKLYDGVLSSLEGLLIERRGRLRFRLFAQLGLAVLLMLAATFVALRFQRGMTRQIDAMTQVFASIGIGDFDSRTAVTSSDELGVLATNLNATFDAIGGLLQTQEDKDRLQGSIQKLLEEVADVAVGDLTVEAEVTEDFTGAIADSFNYMIDQLCQVIYSVQDTTVQVSSAASEVQATTEHLAEGSESQSEQIVNTSSAIDEMALSIQQVSENAATAASVADQATSNARQGTRSVGQTIEGMSAIRQQVQETSKRIKRLGESSQEIGEIVGLIGDIADRTSILALNASIQAAMAGDAGRGFAVVAEEVERLAERSAEATKRIEGLIKTIQSETGEAVAAMEETTREVVSGSGLANEAGQALSEIEAVSNRLAEVINSISMSANQQARGSESVARSMNDISDVTQQTSAGTKQAAVSIRNLAALADNLRESVSTFKLPIRA